MVSWLHCFIVVLYMTINNKKKFFISAGKITSCLRGVVYDKRQEKAPPLHPEIERILAMFRGFAETGQEIQNELREFWRKKGVLVADEDFIPFNDYGLTGRYDAICQIKGKLIIYEIKGAGKGFFKWVMVNKKARPEHKIQLMIYHVMLKEKYPDLEPRIMYVSRDILKNEKKLKGVEVPITYTEEEFERAVHSAELVKNALEGGELPPAAPDVSPSFPYEKDEISLKALTCRHHALCMDNKNWYAEAMRKLGLEIEDI